MKQLIRKILKEELEEKWSKEYKDSIDCDNPKGFSQRAHCDGKKKKELEEYARTLKMARRQGIGTRFPKSAVKNSPSRFRKYTRDLNENLELSSMYIDLAIKPINTINENDEPDFEWDFTDIKKNIDLSTLWVKTKEEAKKYLNLLKEKIKNLDDSLKKKILKYALYSLMGIIGYQAISEPTPVEPEKTELPVKIGGGSKETKIERIRNYDDKLIDHLKYEEGSLIHKGEPILIAYDIGDGAKTIGYGHAVFGNPNRGSTGGNYTFLPKYHKIVPGKTRITKKQAEILLRDDIEDSKNQLNKILNDWEAKGIKPNITQNMYNAMVSMIYNMGIGNFRMSEFIQYVKRGEMEKAKEEIKRTSKHMFGVFPGLEVRRQRESEMFGGQSLNESKNRNTDVAKFLFRRVTKEELDDGFKYTYNYYSDYWKKFKHNDGTFSQFKQVFITTIMDKIHGKLIDGFLGESPADLYNKIMGIINEIYGDRIEKLWTQKTGKSV